MNIARTIICISVFSATWSGIPGTGGYAEFAIVSPAGLGDREGDLRGTIPPDASRLQYIHPASDFATVPSSHQLLTGIALRPDASSGPLSMAEPGMVITLSTTSATELVPRFDDNSGQNATIVFDGPLHWETNAEPGPGPKDFDYRIDFDVPFPYRAEMGNLVIDLTMSGFRPNGFVDSQTIDGAGVVSQYGDANATSAFAGDSVLGVFEFTFVPEPTAYTMLAVGCICLSASLRRPCARRS